MTIIEYVNANDITVKFENGYVTTCQYDKFKNGSLFNPYDISVYEHGYIGEGNYKTHLSDKTLTIQYAYWRGMLRRCYDKKVSKKHPTYENCIVCEEWLCFQTFAKWFGNNYYEIKDDRVDLDKDILHKSNKIYSPDKCAFVPHRINTLFTKRQNDRGEYPIGVTYNKKLDKFIARCCILDDRKYLGLFNASKEAYFTYKEFKEQYIKQIADEYKSFIPKELYDAMYRYEVEITD
jgi:hypothetical protein